MNTLVTGSAGFIGFHTAKKLLDSGDTVIGVDSFNAYYDVKLKEARNKVLLEYPNFIIQRGDLTDLEFVQHIFKNYKIERVCHLAAQAGVRHSLTHPHDYIKANITAFMNVLDEAKNAGIKTFIYASSSSVYGGNKKMPFAVDDPVDQPISLYAATKRADELMAYTYHHLYAMQCTGLRFFTVYGPWGRPDMALFIFTERILKGEKIDVFNFGKMKRNFTYVDDIVAGVVASLDKSYPYEIFNLGGAETVPLMSFINRIEACLGKRAEMNLLPLQQGDVPEAQADISRSTEKLGFVPKTSVSQGVENFVKWYGEYYGEIKN